MAGKVTERVDNITKIPKEALNTKPPIPKSVKIELTAKCNYRCTYCATGAKLRDKREMNKDFYRRIVKEMYEEGVRELGVFYLGESFLCDWLPEAIGYAKEIGYPYVFLTTNGSLATQDIVRECMEEGLDSLKFSFNYADKKQFAEITQTRPEGFTSVIRNIIAAKLTRDALGSKCGLYASSILYDGKQGELMKEAVEEISEFVDEHYWLPLYGQAGLVSDQNREKEVTAGNQGRVGALRPPLPCWSLFTEGRITWDGHLAACCFDHDGRFHMGNLNEMKFKSAWYSEPFQDLRDANLRKNVAGTACEKCVAYGN